MASPPEQQDERRALSPKDRIEQLNAIDKDATKLLGLASSSIQALSSFSPQEHPDSPPPGQNGDEGDYAAADITTNNNNTLEARKAAFKAASAQYFITLQSINIGLSRQVYALEEAGLILPRASPGARRAAAVATDIVKEGGINPLDTGWLNGRKDSVGKDKEAELIAETRRFVAEEAEKEQHDLEESNQGSRMDFD